MIPEKLLDTVDRMLAVVRQTGPESYVYNDTKRLFDRIYDSEIYQRLNVGQLAILTSFMLVQLCDAWDEAERTGNEGKIITL